MNLKMLLKVLKLSISIAAKFLSSIMSESCGWHAAGPMNFNVQGKAPDAQDGSPVKGAAVAISTWDGYKCRQYTDLNGDYSIRDCPVVAAKGTKLHVGQSGYVDKWIDLEITSNLRTVNVALERK